MDAFAPYWNFLLVHPLLSLLVGAYDLIPDFGLAIVIVTVLIRVVLYPLYVTQIRSQRAMQEVGPALKELQSKYGKDRQRMAEEQMKLYKERGVNPAMGCLPLLLQMPILFAMYAAFTQAPQLDGEQLRAAVWPFIPVPDAIGALGHLDLTIGVRMDWHEGFHVYGERGSVIAKTLLPWYLRTSEVECFSDADRRYHRPLGEDSHFFRRQVEGFADTILSGAPMHGASVDDGLAAMRVIEAIEQSADASATVMVRECAAGGAR